MSDTTTTAPDYRDTVFLPQTDFPMRAGLPQREPEWLARWERLGIYDRLRQKSDRTPFILHDGPPYANGNLHIGHALNKVLKDFITRSQQMMGRDARYVPGWDCHGLPPSNGRSRSSIASASSARTTWTWSSSARNAAPLPRAGSRSSASSSSGWASPANGTTPI